MKPNDAFPSLLDEMRAIASRMLADERSSHTLQPTALVNEAYLRLAARDEVSFADKPHFLRVALETMRRVLIDHARGRQRVKRGGAAKRLGLEDAQEAAESVDPQYEFDDLISLYDALAELRGEDPQLALVVELRVGGFTMVEIASALGVAERTAYNDWATALAKLRRLMPNEEC